MACSFNSQDNVSLPVLPWWLVIKIVTPPCFETRAARFPSISGDVSNTLIHKERFIIFVLTPLSFLFVIKIQNPMSDKIQNVARVGDIIRRDA